MKVIFVGPKENPITGQSLSFKELFDSFNLCEKNKINYGDNSFIGLIVFFFRYIKTVSFSSFDKLYLTTSRSKLGFFRDAFVILTFKIFNTKSEVVNHLHGADFISFRTGAGKGILLKLVDFVYGFVNHSIVLTESMKEQYSSFPSMKVSCLNNFYTFNNEFNLESSVKDYGRVIFLSNLIASKGIFELIESIKKLQSIGYFLQLDIAGYNMLSGDDAVRFEEALNQYDFIKYHGVVEGSKKEVLLEQAGFFCLPTYYPTEAQPISIIEALAKGCVIISTKHNYIPDFISNQNGALVRPKDSESLCSAFQEMLMRKDLSQIAKFNIEHAKNNFSRQKITRQFCELINSTSKK
ncbi:glycosyltransferase family 4 protein [Vibrio cincinnatiensis]